MKIISAKTATVTSQTVDELQSIAANMKKKIALMEELCEDVSDV